MALTDEVDQLAWHMFPEDTGKQAVFVRRVVELCSVASDKDFLLIHNPGGWGSTKKENLLQWERSIVEGVSTSMEGLGYECSFFQYFRSETGWRAILGDIREQTRFFKNKARVMSTE